MGLQVFVELAVVGLVALAVALVVSVLVQRGDLRSA